MARPAEYDRDEVLGRAMQAFWDNGYCATSVSQLVEATRRYLEKHGVSAEVEYSWGATEVKAPLLVTEGLRFLEKTTSSPPENPLAGMRGTMLAGFSIIGGALLVGLGAPWYAAAALFVFAGIVALRRGS